MWDTNSNRLYRALSSRDARFDGRIFVGVTSTGVYCRPICPARTPKRENVKFFACAAAAEQAGFRACRRCHPEASPGTPGWLGTSATVSRALRLIGAGALDTGSLDELATRLGVGGRHLRRLFAEHLGTSPVAVAQTRRTHFARRLIDDTDLPMTEIAAQAGFSSIRRFNAAMRDAFDQKPTDIRRAARPQTAKPHSGVALRLTYRPPLDWESQLGYLAARATPGVESVEGETYRRTVRVGGHAGIIEVRRPRPKSPLELRVDFDEPAGLLEIVTRTRTVFDLDADPHQIADVLRNDTRLAPLLAARPGLRVPGGWDVFEVAVRAILGQQISVAAATTLAGRLANRYGEPFAGSIDEKLNRLFPTPQKLSRANLQTIGLTAARAKTLRIFASEVAHDRIRLDAAQGLERALEQLTALPGIGPWTAQYIAMRGLREPDAFPAGDLGLRRSFFGNEKLATESQLAKASESWRPWRAYAAAHLWRDDADVPPTPE